MTYQMIIGIETHIELKTKKKIFCDCEVTFGKEPNTKCCPMGSGVGGEPKYNGEVTEFALRAGLSLNCKINSVSKFDRKHYKSEDLPKGYQITQYYYPICSGGYVLLDSGKKINLNRIHIEEDVGKTVNLAEKTLIDFNRSGVPLIEVVTAPDIANEQEAGEFVEKLQALMKYAGVSTCKMNQGEMRCDINLSLRKETVCGNRVEIKNLNSVANIKKAIKSEYIRQSQILDKGEKVLKQTLKFDEKVGKCLPMRDKESTADYDYIAEPRLLPIKIEQDFIERESAKIGELPAQKIERLEREYKLSSQTAKLLCRYKKVAEFFESVVKENANALVVANLITGTVFSKLTEDEKEEFDIKFSPKDLAKLSKFIDKGYLFNNAQKALLEMMQGKPLEQIVTEKDLQPITEEELMKLCEKSLQQNSIAVQKYKGGNCKAINALVGYCMKNSTGIFDAKKAENIILGLIRE